MLGLCFGVLTFVLLIAGSEGVRQGSTAPGIEVGGGRFRLHREVAPDASGFLEERQSRGAPDLPDDEVLQAVVGKSKRLVRYWEPADQVVRLSTFRAMYTAVDQQTGEDVVVTLFYVMDEGKRYFLTLSKNENGLKSVTPATLEEEAYLLSEERQCHMVHRLLEKARSKSHPAAKRILDCFESHVADGSAPAFVVTAPGPQKMDTDLRFYTRAKHRNDYDRVARVKTAHEAAMQMLSLIDLMSGEGIVHHDFHPKNLLFQLNEPNTPDIQMKLTGWNYASDQELRLKGVRGCQHFLGLFKNGGYIPPEGCGSDGSSAYDIFSVGIILAEWLAPYTLRSDPHWAKLMKADYGNLSDKDIDELQTRSLRENFLFPDSDARLLKQMLTNSFSQRPTARAAAAMLYPKWLQKLGGTWISSGSARKYIIKHLGEQPPVSGDMFYEFYPVFHVEVRKDDSLKGEGSFSEVECLPDGSEGAVEARGDASCCRVPVRYKGKVGVFPRTCEVILTLCGSPNTDRLEAMERTRCIWKPEGMVKKTTSFSRLQ